MKPVDAGQNSDNGENLTHICRLWTIERKDGVIFRFTDHDAPIYFEGERYDHETSFNASAVQTQAGSAAADLDVNVLLAPGSIEYMALQRGLFDEAPTTLRVISWLNPENGAITIYSGALNTITLPSIGQGILQLTGPIGRIGKSLVERYSPSCRANFGDARCKYDLALVTTDYTVTAVESNQRFVGANLAGREVAFWRLGTIEWTTGTNKGTRQEVATNDADGRISLLFRPPMPMDVGDTGRIIRGCYKTLNYCMAYGNKANYRGEPFVPGDSVVR